jgi:hypothetical protein
MVTIDFSLIGADGDTINLDGGLYTLETGLKGLGIPAPVLRIDPSAKDGGVYRYSMRDIRELDLPITIADSGVVEPHLRRLARMLQGPVRLVATYETGQRYELVTYLAGGGETQFGSDATVNFCRWVITLQAPQPFWQSVDPISFSVTAATETRGLLGNLSKLQVKTSQALGAVVIENSGDVEAPVIWQLEGPADSVAITLGGVGFTYDDVIDTGETITINTDLGTVTDQLGANKYAALAAAPKLFAIPTGSSTVSITAAGASTATKISGFFSPRREVIH